MADTETHDGDRGERTHALDDIDRTLLRELIADGRATLAQLALQAGLSVSAVQSRVRRLEARGVITGYTARVDPGALGEPLAALVSISPADPTQPDDAPTRLRNLPAVKACHSVAGSASYMLLVRVASPAGLESLLRDIRSTVNADTHSTVILRTFFER